jgi:hypothetical protein
MIIEEAPVIPTVGMGATYCIMCDMYPYTIVEVLSPRRIVVQPDRTIAKGDSCLYSLNEKAPKETITLRKNGRWCRVNQSMYHGFFHIGSREFSNPREV